MLLGVQQVVEHQVTYPCFLSWDFIAFLRGVSHMVGLTRWQRAVSPRAVWEKSFAAFALCDK
jgi:hypothetical protein